MDQCKSHCPTTNNHCILEFPHLEDPYFDDRSTYKFGNEQTAKMSKVIGSFVEQSFNAHTLQHNDHHYRSRLHNVLVGIYLLEIRHSKQLG